jgi:hypothetical protein
MADRELARQVKEDNKSVLLSMPNVVGVGVGEKSSDGRKTGEICVVIMVREKLPEAGLARDMVLPREVSGVKTDVVQVGDLHALQARTDRWRPAPGGVSLGHYKITAGTFGAVVRDQASGARLILSNNHVLANSNDAAIGDPILQPGPYDGGQLDRDRIAVLERFCPLQFNTAPPTCSIASAVADFSNALASLVGSKHRLQAHQVNAQAANLADCAVARPDSDGLILDEIVDIGTVTGTIPATLGMLVRKSGRTTGFTTGQINVIDATVSVSYGTGKTATFDNQLVAGPMSQGGDSGSLLVAANSLQAVGLLFAGSDQSTIFNPIQAVLDCLQVTI